MYVLMSPRAFAAGILTGTQLGTAILLVMAALAIARARDLGTIRIPLVRGATRTGLVLSRFASLTLLATLMMGAAVLSSWCAAGLLFDFGDVQEKGYTIVTAAEVRTENAIALASALVPLMAGIGGGLLASVVAPSSQAAVTWTLICTYSFDILAGALGDGASYVFVKYLPTLAKGCHLEQAVDFAAGYSNTEHYDPLNFIAPVPEALLFLGLAIILIHRRKL